MEYRIETLPGFELVGLAVECPMTDNSAIPPLWDKFLPLMEQVQDMRGVWGACLPGSDAEHFLYVAGCEVPSGGALPEGMSRHTIPAHRYITHAYTGKPCDMGKYWMEASPKLMAASGEKMRMEGPWLERYPCDCHDEATGHITCDLLTPVV